MAQAALKFTGSRMANPTRTPSPAQLAARERFAEMARSGGFAKRRKAAPKRKTNPSTNQGLAIYLDAIAQGETYSESKLMEALEHPAAASMADQTVIKAALRGAPYSHTKLHDIAIKIRQHGAVAKAIKASRSKIGATEAKTINRLLMGRHGNPSMKTYNFSANGLDFGNYKAASLTAAKTKFAHDAGYRSWAYMVSEAEENGGNNIEINELTGGGGFVKRNPDKSKPRAYVRRVSQATGAPPSKRLTARRKAALEAPAGYFPNPKSKRTYTVYWELPHSANSTTLGVFFSLEKAKQYARAHAKLYPSHYVRVESRG